MKFDNPVSVPVDSILAWGGCDTEDLLDAKFHACDVADSTTGKDMALGGIGSSCGGQASLLTMDNLDSLLMHGPAHPHATSSLTPHPSTPHSNGHSFAELKPLTPYDYGPLPSLSTDLSTGSEVDAVTGSSSSSNLNANPCEPGPGGGGRTILDINLNLYKATCSSSGGGGGGGVYFSTEPVSTTSSLVNGLVSVVSGLQKEVGVAEYLMNPEIDDIAAIIGNAIADSTVNHVAVDPHQIHGPHGGGGLSMAMSMGMGMGMGMGGMGGPDLRDPWADIDAWIESACATAYKNEPMLESPGSSITSGSSLGSTAGTTVFGHHSAHRLPPGGGGGGSSSANSGHLTSSCSVTSTLQSLLTSGLNPGASSQGGSGSGPADHAIMAIKSEPSLDMPLLQRRLTAGRGPESSSTSHYVSCSLAGKDSVPHTTSYSGSSGGPPNLNQVTTTIPHISNDTVHSSTFPRRSAPKNPPKMELDLGDDLMGPSLSGVGSGSSSSNKKNKSRLGKSKMTTIMTTENGKEKPVHRCNICNRGFLNKSNIKVHLRTHTGEKPFKCDACAKAFRQKAHLLKHMQIHKRITRD